MQAMIFAAGFGTRLKPITDTLPKALVEVRNRPVLDWNIQNLIQHGINRIIVNTHYQADQISDYIASAQYPIPIQISHEPEILGTGGGLYKTKDYWLDDSVFLCNVDILCDGDISAFINFHQRGKNLITLATNNKQSDSMFIIDSKTTLIGWRNGGTNHIFRSPVGELNYVGFAGWHMISKRIFQLINEPVPFSVRDLYFDFVRQGIKVGTWDIGPAKWIDIGTIESLETANREFPDLF